MAGYLSFEKRTKKGACLVLLCSSNVCITSLLDMAINLQLIIKITRSDRSGFQSKDCKAKCQTDHDWKQKSKADIYVRSYRERFGLCYYDSLFFLFVLFVVYFSAIMFIFFMWLELFWAWPSYTRIPLKRLPIPIPIHTHMRHLLCSCRLLLRRMLTPECYSFTFSIVLLQLNKDSIARSCRASCRVTVRGVQGSQSALVLFLLRNW